MRKGTLSLFIAMTLTMTGLLGLFIITPVSGVDPAIDAGSDAEFEGPNYGFFTENVGQWDSSIRYMGGSNFGAVALTSTGVLYNLQDQIEETDHLEEVQDVGGHVLKMDFDGANNARMEPSGMMPHKNN